MKAKKEARICMRCGVAITRRSPVNLCRNCKVYYKNKRHREKKKVNNLCYDCGKPVKPVILYPNGINGIKIIKHPTRCYSCRLKVLKTYKAKNTLSKLQEEQKK